MGNHYQAVQLLAQKGAPINAINGKHQTPLHIAVELGFCETVRTLLDCGADLTIPEKSTGNTPLLAAASKGNVEIGKLLLSRGADINSQPVANTKTTALSISSEKGNKQS